MKTKGLYYLEKVAKLFEIIIALLLLIVIAIKVVETVFYLSGVHLEILFMDFERILSVAFTLVIGVEFTKMLIKLTPETVIDVLLLAIARQTIIYHDRTIDLLIGVAAIAGLFAIKKYLLEIYKKQKSPDDPGENP